eukprot:3963453-Lingulodinium_polyedra.AAC.1
MLPRAETGSTTPHAATRRNWLNNATAGWPRPANGARGGGRDHVCGLCDNGWQNSWAPSMGGGRKKTKPSPTGASSTNT